jgi:hypothetical protein
MRFLPKILRKQRKLLVTLLPAYQVADDNLYPFPTSLFLLLKKEKGESVAKSRDDGTGQEVRRSGGG